MNRLDEKIAARQISSRRRDEREVGMKLRESARPRDRKQLTLAVLAEIESLTHRTAYFTLAAA
jgi:hypothetical protein